MPLTKSDLQTIYNTLLRFKKTKEEEELSDLFVEKPRLIISPNNFCKAACTHCIADSTTKGEHMSYSNFTKINPEFFGIFSDADFGRRGNPLEYNSEGHDLADLLAFLNKNGINNFTLALALQEKSLKVNEKIVNLVNYQKAKIETMVTYHHYYKNLDTQKLAKKFNSTLKNYLAFSEKILVSLLGDKYSQKDHEVQETFKKNWETIFQDISLTQINDFQYRANFNSKTSLIEIPEVDSRVYPLGRFRTDLTKREIMDEYELAFEKGLGDYVCPDMIKWPGIIIEPNGDLNLCASFEAINCKGAIVTNIFEKPYLQVEKELIALHQKEKEWFRKNLGNIIDGKVSTCKMKNGCYSQ